MLILLDQVTKCLLNHNFRFLASITKTKESSCYLVVGLAQSYG